MNSRHNNISFTLEEESGKKLPFLDVNISREKGVFITNVYRKPTFSGVYTNVSGFIPTHYKHGLVMSLLYRCFYLCSDLIKFHHEVSELKLILGRNGYPSKVIDFCIRNFLNKIHLPKKTVATAAKKEIFIMLPFLSLQIRTRIPELVASKLPYYNLKVVFRSTRRLSNCFSFKDKIPKFMCINFRVVTAMSPIMAKLKTILKFVCQSISVFHLKLEKLSKLCTRRLLFMITL